MTSEGVTRVALSFMGLRRRNRFVRPWKAKDYYEDDQHLFLDSGAYTVNSNAADYSPEELQAISDQYIRLVEANADRVTLVSEFDALALGYDWVKDMRHAFYDDLEPDKFLPVWHSEYGVEELHDLCRRYHRVGITQTSLDGRDLIPTLNTLVRETGVKLHGIAMTKPDLMKAIRWDSVASTSWISPQQYGDTIVWTGKEMKRYPKKYKDQARKRHRTLFDQAGFDTEKIEADDTTELLRVSIWSWKELMRNLDHAEVVTEHPETHTSDSAENQGDAVDRPSEEGRKSPSTALVRSRATVPLPGLAMGTFVERGVDEDGKETEVAQPLLNVRSESLRACDTCFLKARCPGFESGANCAYNIPIEIRNSRQLRALQDSLVEIQAQRVLFMRLAEDTEGGYADPNLSNEIDRLQRLIKSKNDIESDSFTFKVEAKGNAQAGGGVLTRLFGPRAADAATALPAPVDADEIIGTVISVDGK